MSDFIFSLVLRVVRLYEENEKLKKEVRSRRHQSDVWRKKFHNLMTLLKGVLTETDLKALEDLLKEKASDGKE